MKKQILLISALVLLSSCELGRSRVKFGVGDCIQIKDGYIEGLVSKITKVANDGYLIIFSNDSKTYEFDRSFDFVKHHIKVSCPKHLTN